MTLIQCVRVCMCALRYLVVSHSLQPHGLQPARLLHPQNFPGKNIGVGYHAFFQGIFLMQGSNSCLLCLLHWLAGSLSPVPPVKPLLSAYYMLSLVLYITHFTYHFISYLVNCLLSVTIYILPFIDPIALTSGTSQNLLL